MRVAAPRPTHNRFARLRRYIGLLLAINLLVGLAVAAFSIFSARERNVQLEGQRLRTLAVALRENADGVFAGAELALRDLRRQIEAGGGLAGLGPTGAHLLMRRALANLPPHYSFFLTDARGRLAAHSVGDPAPDVDLSDRPYFTRLRASPGDEVFLNGLTKARATGEWTFYLALPLREPHGSFDGTLAIVIQHSYFEAFYRQLALEADSSINLIKTDGALLARIPFREEDVQVELGNHPSFRQALADRRGYLTTETSAFSRNARIIGFDQSNRYPVLATASQGLDPALTAWRETALRTAGLVVVGMLLFLAMGAYLLWQLRLLERATYETVHDALTGLHNRRGFDRIAGEEWQRARRERQPLSMLMIDVDDFKNYNDLYGHLAGDQCLRRVAHTIDRALKRPADFSARYGGEEFVCLLANTDAEGAKEVAQAILTAVRKKEIPHGGSRAGDVVTVSIGGATWEPGDAGMLGDLVAAADAALYEAKAEGRNRVCYWVRDAAAGNRTSDDRRLV